MDWVPVVVRAEPPLTVEPVEFLVRGWRNWYLASAWPELVAYFGPLLREGHRQAELCLKDENGTVVPWHIPWGVSVDLRKLNQLEAIPVTLTLALEPPVPTSISPLDIYQFFLQQLKESCYIRDGNSSAVMTLNPNDSQALWAAACARNDDEYKRLLPVRLVKRVPIKVYSGNKPRYIHGDPNSTLGLLLNSQLPHLFASTRIALDAEALLRGAAVPLSAPLGQLYEFKYLDGFLHLVVKPKGVKRAVGESKIAPNLEKEDHDSA